MIEDLTDFFKAVGDSTRLRIINLLINYPALNVNDLTTILKLPQSKISRHLSVLRHSKWLVFNRRDKWVYYKINPELDPQLLDAFRNLFKNYLHFESDLKSVKHNF